MKYLNILFLAVFFLVTATFVKAQDANFMNYQAVAHNAAGEVMANESISLRISILKGSPEGIASFVETHEVATNQFGLFNLQIGRGAAEKGSFEEMQWNANRFFLKIELYNNGWQTLGISELATVPYAMAATWATEAAHAKTSDHALIADSVRNMGNGKNVVGGLINRANYQIIQGKPNNLGDIWIADDKAGSVYFNDGANWYLISASVACTTSPTGVSSGMGATNVTGTTFNLTGSVLQIGETGQWVITAGNNGSFSDPTANNAIFTGNAGEVYNLKWVVSNACGTTEGNQISVSFANPCPVYVDVNGTPYTTRAIGSQCWMVSNLTQPTSGVWDGTVDYNTDGIADGARYYNWTSALTICQSGWHLPTLSDATALINYHATQGLNAFATNGFNASAAGWKEMNYNPSFGLHNVGTESYYWLQNAQDGNFSYYLHSSTYNTNSGFSTPGGTNSLYKGYGALVRCIKD